MRLRRWVMIAIGVPVYAFLVMLALTWSFLALAIDEWPVPSGHFPSVVELVSEPEWWAWFGGIATIFVLSQAVFLIPICKRRPPRTERGKSLFVSMAIAGAIGAGLTAGLFMSIGTFMEAVLEFDPTELIGLAGALILLLVLMGSWVFWSALLIVYVRGIWAERLLGRLVAIVFAGTVIELICILPLDVMVRRRTDCYCLSGTLFNLAFGVAALLWLAGPGIIIALVWHRRRAWTGLCCGTCGYEKGPTPGRCCPECGSEWGERI